MRSLSLPAVTGDLGPVSANLVNFGLRTLSALILAPLVLGAVWLGGVAFFILLAAASVFALMEWQKVSGSANRLNDVLYATSGPAFVAMFYIGGVGLAVLAVFGGAIAAIFLAPKSKSEKLWRAGGLIYIGIPIVALIYVRNGGPGVTLSVGRDAMLFLLAAVWGSDIGAYAFGRLIGGAKLAPRISPSKTWAGAIGGIVVAGFAVVPVYHLGSDWADEYSLSIIFSVGAVLAIASQIGDLFESSVKRHFNVKDTGTLIPGHGGILDRIDGLLFAAPVMASFYFYIVIAGS